MPATVSLPIGERFGRLEVLAGAAPTATSGRLVLCRCDCGTEKVVRLRQLRSGMTQSCGCLRSEVLRAPRRHGHAARGAQHPLYSSWKSMIERCENPNCRAYQHYGGRGIRVCARWRADFTAFLADMGERPDGHSIDRIDNDGDYEPGNCRWATAETQARNQRARRPRPRLLPDAVAEIRARHRAGERQVDIAADHGVSQHTISRVVRARPPYDR